MIVAFIFQDCLLKALFWPLGAATGGNPPHLYYRTLAEPFTLYMRIGIIAGLVISSPYGAHQVWQFIAAGLYPNERSAVRRCVLPSLGLFLLGMAFYFVLLSPMVVRWFLSFSAQAFPNPPIWGPDWLYKYVGGAAPTTLPSTLPYVQPILALDDYVSFTVMMSVAFGVAFQMPLVVYLLIRAGIVQAETMRKFRKYVMVIVVIASAVITPTGDAFTMLAMAVPMYLLYEVGLLIGGRKSHARQRAG